MKWHRWSETELKRKEEEVGLREQELWENPKQKVLLSDKGMNTAIDVSPWYIRLLPLAVILFLFAIILCLIGIGHSPKYEENWAFLWSAIGCGILPACYIVGMIGWLVYAYGCYLFKGKTPNDW